MPNLGLSPLQPYSSTGGTTQKWRSQPWKRHIWDLARKETKECLQWWWREIQACMGLEIKYFMMTENNISNTSEEKKNLSDCRMHSNIFDRRYTL